MSDLAFLASKFATALVLPPAGPLILAVAGVFILYSAKHRFGRGAGVGILWCSFIGLFVLSLPAVGHLLMASLDRYQPIGEKELARAQAIVILGGGVRRNAPEFGGDTISYSSLERLRYGARLAQAGNLPVMVTSGSPYGGRPEADLMRESLEREFHVAARWSEGSSRNTLENAAFSARMLRDAGISRIALVSHSWHLPRAVQLFERQGITVLPAPTVFATGSASLFGWIIPGDLGDARIALHEYLGILFNYLTDPAANQQSELSSRG